MKALLASVGLLLVGAVSGVVFLWPAPPRGPQPIAYGRDACAHCRMHVSQPGFGGEIRDRNGVLTKYDDVGCMLRAMVALHEEIPEAWVEDHAGSGFVPLLTAHLVRRDDGGTPMGYGIIAFADPGAAASYARLHRGQIVSLEAIIETPGRLAERPGMPAAGGNGGDR